ncbi:hypothetical protein THITH_12650 [Thioalkalivibrio paradoxus ARh 1]|uniref:Uncharacterized protein n=1 Tax=Thioalkalivibrio paradoxus ARh 1 TaxID=713585 RepID=W0DNR6_9GAMM|nr:hypothetical protein THITH_12650 [Thioalkalivibrio paradoxus ARh 1]
MRDQKHIAVLFHARSLRKDLRSSVVFHLADRWRASGHRVTMLRGTRRYVPADVLFVHVDLSVVPDEYLELASRYPAAINHRVKDIRKSRISEQLVSAHDQWNGPVIVKSDLNYGGEPERRLGTPRALRWARAGGVLGRLHRSWLGGSIPGGWQSYRLYQRAGLVPPELWEDPAVVIERFLPEVEAGRFHLRVYQFLGDRSTCRRLASDVPIVKAANRLHSEQVEPHPIVATWRDRLGLDYGKLDYVIHEGTPILLDVNKTTGVDHLSAPERQRRRQYLAEGIGSFFV